MQLYMIKLTKAIDGKPILILIDEIAAIAMNAEQSAIYRKGCDEPVIVYENLKAIGDILRKYEIKIAVVQ